MLSVVVSSQERRLEALDEKMPVCINAILWFLLDHVI